MATLGHFPGGRPHSRDVNHCVLHFRPEGHPESRNEVGSLGLAKGLVGFELGTFGNISSVAMEKYIGSSRMV